KRYQTDSVVLAGGCAYNSVANGKILERSPFRHVYVQSAGGDAGGSIGAAFATWHKVEGEKAKRHFVMDHAYWCPSATPEHRAVDPARDGEGLVRDRRRRALHDAGLQDQA